MLLTTAAAAFLTFGLFGIGGDTINFDNQKPGARPAYWGQTATRPAERPHWEIRLDSTAPSRPNVLSQVSPAANDSEFPLAVFDKVICRDGDLSVKFKIADGPGKIKTAGIVWRYQDQRNYYLLHFSVDEKNIVLFRVQNGQTHAIPVAGGQPGAFGVKHDLRTGQWYVAKVVFRGNNFRVLFGNRQLFQATDDTLDAPGKTGVWTRGGTIASFDDFRIDKKG
ncbi:MAG TPA: hypothetical protein VHZ74_16620 [Bryobacteraceae bacterium]|nr:hypothetical protein [Bryobacteraceae bacterium]